MHKGTYSKVTKKGPQTHQTLLHVLKTLCDLFVRKLIVRVVSRFQQLSPDADGPIMNISPTHHHRQHQLTWNDLESLDQVSVLLYEMVSFSLQWCQTSVSPFHLN